jgi:hypothetical protein
MKSSLDSDMVEVLRRDVYALFDINAGIDGPTRGKLPSPTSADNGISNLQVAH